MFLCKENLKPWFSLVFIKLSLVLLKLQNVIVLAIYSISISNFTYLLYGDKVSCILKED